MPTDYNPEITDPVELYERFVRSLTKYGHKVELNKKPSDWLHYSKKQQRGMCKSVGNKFTVHPEDLKLLDEGYMSVNEVREYFKEVCK